MAMPTTIRPYRVLERRGSHRRMDGDHQRQAQSACARHRKSGMSHWSKGLGHRMARALTASGTCSERTMEADVSIYTIDPRGLVATSGAPAEKDQGQDWYPVIARGPLDGARYSGRTERRLRGRQHQQPFGRLRADRARKQLVLPARLLLNEQSRRRKVAAERGAVVAPRHCRSCIAADISRRAPTMQKRDPRRPAPA